MSPKHSPRIPRIPTSFVFSFFLTLFVSLPGWAQNSYPASGDALIHGLTVGTGPGSQYNTAFGINALYSGASGSYNTAIGTNALFENALGQYNVAVGNSALAGNYNTNSNTAVGTSALSNNSGTGNTAIGLGTLVVNGGYSNVAVGIYALYNNLFNSNLVAIGDSSLLHNTTGTWNTAVGSKSLFSNNSGYQNTALGFQALYYNTTGYDNTSTGHLALHNNQTGEANNAYGVEALYSNTSGWDNTASGNDALYHNSSGNYNTASGAFSLYSNTSGSYISAFGLFALATNTTGNYNTSVGSYADVGSSNLSNATAIGYGAIAGVGNNVSLGNTSVTSIGGYANWTNFSDGRYKKNIKENVPGLSFIKKLQPITYTLDINGIETKLHENQKTAKSPDRKSLPNPMDDPIMKQAMQEKSQIVYTGFIAQDVDKAAQSVGYNFSGVDKPKDDQQSFYGLRYGDFVVPLVKAVQELSAANDSLAAANAQLSSRLDQVEQILGIKSNDQNRTVLSLSSARLFQNIPNPFNQTTLINYYVPQNSGPAFIQITGINGEMIKQVALNGSGIGQVNVQTGQLAAGTYTYSLFVDSKLIDTKRMVLAK